MVWPSQTNAQYISVPDTVCVNQDVKLSTKLLSDNNYYWGSCSAFLERAPKGRIIAANAPLQGPTSLSLQKDGDNFYLFVVNYEPTFEIIRYDFGSDLSAIPTPVNLGNFGNLVPQRTTGIDFYKDNGNWVAFLIGGIGVNSNLLRLDFGSALSNSPTSTNLGDLSGLIISPQDIHFFKENGNYFAYYFNGLSGNQMRLDFGNSVNNTPSVVDLGSFGGIFSFPAAIEIVEQFGSKYAFVVNRLSGDIVRMDYGTSLLNTPVTTNLGNFSSLLDNPRDMNIFYDNNSFYGFVTNEATNNITFLKFGNNISNIPTASNSTNFASFNGVRGISNFFRQKDNVYGFASNFLFSNISQIHFDSSANATILKQTVKEPSIYQYTTPGLYNVFYSSTDSSGKVYEEQKQIRVLAKPRLDLHVDTTICQGDTIFMVANGGRLKSILWEPSFNLLYQNDTTSVYVYPSEDYKYNIHMEFDYGCILDTSINVYVSKIKADAGQDREVADGATTTLGGPGTSLGFDYLYKWTPATYLDNSIIAAPTARLSDSLQFYYLEVKNSFGCVDLDTVAIKSFCGEINCPNAFNPTSINATNRKFGIENYQLNKLDYFRVYNRFGEVVFETTNPFIKWDGYFKGTPQPLGTYVWHAQGICNNGRKVIRKGNVSLLR
jgi:hypothetical protein